MPGTSLGQRRVGKGGKLTTQSRAGCTRGASVDPTVIITVIANSFQKIVRSIRGVGGDVELAKPAEEITIGEVISRFEGSMHLLDCVAIENVCVTQPGFRR